MNKTLNINLGGLIFHIDEEAFLKLEKYLTTLKMQFSKSKGGSEIIKDIEVRIAELFKERTSDSKEVISLADVDEVISIMGKPEDYLDSEDEMNESYSSSSAHSQSKSKRVFREPDDKILGGVASGLAAYLNIEALWMRIFFVVLAFSGFSILFYIILWALIPKASTTGEKLQMRGERVNVSNIEKSVKEEFSGLGENVKDLGQKASNYDYRKPANQLGEMIRDFASFILNAVKFIIKFFFKMIGFLFLAMGFVVLMAFVLAFFTGSFEIIDGGYNLNDLYDFLRLVTANDAHFNLMVLGSSLLLLAPIVMITYLGVRIIFKLDRLGRSARAGLTGAAILGFILVLISGIRISLEFERRGDHITYQKLHQSEKIYLKVNENEIYDQLKDTDFSVDWLQLPQGNVFTQVDLNIRKSMDGELKIKTKKRSQGKTRRSARKFAENTKYTFKQKSDSIVSINSYYLLPNDEKYRAQEVSLTFYLPIGTQIFIDDNMAGLLYSGGSWRDYSRGYDMVNRTWVMTKKGLKCLDCPTNENYDYEEEYYDDFESYDDNDEENEMEDVVDSDQSEEELEEEGSEKETDEEEKDENDDEVELKQASLFKANENGQRQFLSLGKSSYWVMNV